MTFPTEQEFKNWILQTSQEQLDGLYPSWDTCPLAEMFHIKFKKETIVRPFVFATWSYEYWHHLPSWAIDFIKLYDAKRITNKELKEWASK